MSDFERVAGLADLPPGGVLIVEYDDEEEVGLINYNGRIYAMANVCPHDNGTLFDGDIEDQWAICPRHGARFNFVTGEYTLPSFAPAGQFEVKIEGNDIFIRE